MPVLQAVNVSHRYNQTSPTQFSAIENVNIEIENGELVGIIGHTGSGKSTLVQHFNGLLKPTEGKILLEGKDIWESKKTVHQARFKVGLCFQYPEYQLFEETVYKDIAFGPKNMKLSEEDIDKAVRKAAEYVGVTEDMFNKSPFDLSGGEKRRVAIAGVMAMQPEVLILDEPTAGLDPKGRDRILDMVKAYQQDTKKTVIFVSHSMEDVAKLATKVLVMNRSRVAMFDTVDNVYSRAEELTQMGLNVPQVTKIFMSLKNKGIDVSENVYTVEQGKAELLRLLGGSKL